MRSNCSFSLPVLLPAFPKHTGMGLRERNWINLSYWVNNTFFATILAGKTSLNLHNGNTICLIISIMGLENCFQMDTCFKSFILFLKQRKMNQSHSKPYVCHVWTIITATLCCLAVTSCFGGQYFKLLNCFIVHRSRSLAPHVPSIAILMET